MSTTPEIQCTPNLLLEGLHTYCDELPGFSSILYIDIIGFSHFEQNQGTKACEIVVCALADVLKDILSQILQSSSKLRIFHVWDDSFAVLLPYSTGDIYMSLIHQWVMKAEGKLNEKISKAGYSSLYLRYGIASSTTRNKIENPESLYKLITQAGRIARRQTGLLPLHIVQELESILQNNEIRMHYQPILQLKTRSTIGWECLARGPKNSVLESPVTLFSYAERTGHLLEMERICRNQAIRNAKVDRNRKLFINISPKILSDPSFRKGETLTIINQMGLVPEQIVFEITEHHAIKEYPAFLHLVHHYRKQGYKIAIDDVGAGHSGLVTLMQVKPDFVKIDMELIRDVEKDGTKQDIIKAIHQISTGFSAKVIAEGIETANELACLQGCGIELGQGFLLGKPKLHTVR